MASNTFIDGEAIIDKYPMITDVLTGIQTKADEMGESFNLDCLRATPTALFYDHKRAPKHMQEMAKEEQPWEEEWEEPVPPQPTPVRDFMEEQAN